MECYFNVIISHQDTIVYVNKRQANRQFKSLLWNALLCRMDLMGFEHHSSLSKLDHLHCILCTVLLPWKCYRIAALAQPITKLSIDLCIIWSDSAFFTFLNKWTAYTVEGTSVYRMNWMNRWDFSMHRFGSPMILRFIFKTKGKNVTISYFHGVK